MVFEEWRARHAAHRAEQAAREAAERYTRDLQAWQERHDAAASMLDMASTFAGLDTADIVLKPGERVYGSVAGASLVEERSVGAHWAGGSQGFSVPVGSVGGHAVRYHVGAARGHYVQGIPTPTAVDQGTLWITDRRVLFVGARQTRECPWDKAVAVAYQPSGQMVVSLSNRQHPVVVSYGPDLAGWVQFRGQLALAHYQGTVDSYLAALRQALAQADAARPLPPSAPPEEPAG